MNAAFLYGNALSERARVAFDSLWESHSSSGMGELRRALRVETGNVIPPAPQYDADVNEWRYRLVQWCDAMVLSHRDATIESFQLNTTE
jgi:hypothetical protein